MTLRTASAWLFGLALFALVAWYFATAPEGVERDYVERIG